RKVAGGAEARAQLLVEAEVDVHLLVGGAVERPHRRLGVAAPRAGGVGEQHYDRGLVLVAELPPPEPLRVLEHRVHEVDELLLLPRAPVRPPPPPPRPPPPPPPAAADGGEEGLAEHSRQDAEDHPAPEPELHAPAAEGAAPAAGVVPPTILDVLAVALFPAHPPRIRPELPRGYTRPPCPTPPE